MDSNLLSALIGIVGGLIGVAVGAYLQQRVTDAQQSRQTTLQLYERLDDSDILESRIRADKILSENAASGNPQSLSQLYASLSRDDWRHISRTRHFLDQIGMLYRIGYLDHAIAVPLFGSFVRYWVHRYFGPLEELDASVAKSGVCCPHQWRVSSGELRKFFGDGK